MLRSLTLTAAAVILVSCATPYQPEGLTGGFGVKELRPDVYRVSFQGNGFTSKESVQVYWLNRCAELAVEKGFTGFEILSDMQFVIRTQPENDSGRIRLSSSVPSLKTVIPVTGGETAEAALFPNKPHLANRSDASVKLARGGSMMIFYGGGAAVPKPGLEADVHFLATPVESSPPKIFNARALLAQLDPIIKDVEKCGGNVCPHVHDYLLPKGKLR